MLKYDSAYFYNECYLYDFFKVSADEWITPVISGFIEIAYCRVLIS